MKTKVEINGKKYRLAYDDFDSLDTCKKCAVCDECYPSDLLCEPFMDIIPDRLVYFEVDNDIEQ